MWQVVPDNVLLSERSVAHVQQLQVITVLGVAGLESQLALSLYDLVVVVQLSVPTVHPHTEEYHGAD